MKRAYWNHITLLLQQNPPDLSWIPNMLKDINKRFIKLVPTNPAPPVTNTFII